MAKTIFFEERCGENISKFYSTKEIDRFVGKRMGTKLKIKKMDTNLVHKSGNVLDVSSANITSRFRKMLGID